MTCGGRLQTIAAMKTLNNAFVTIAAVLSTAFITPTFAEEAKTKDATASPQMSDAEMMAKMTELAKLNENHKLLAQLAGTWTYTVKMWMAPDAPTDGVEGERSPQTDHGKPLLRRQFHR